jgi:tetratricopeptide (TPR) repeat protein
VSGSAHISDLTLDFGQGPRWAMVRSHFGISSFGVNAYTGSEAGADVIGEHDEAGPRAARHQELYFVANGHATFTVNGDELDAPYGTFVFVRDPEAKRKAVALEAGTTVLAIGSAPGVAFTPSQWERQAPILGFFADKEYDKAIEGLQELLAESPDDPTSEFNLACAYALTGKKQEALDHLRRAVELDPEFRDNARTDSDLDSIREEPEFSAIAGETSSAGSGS